MRMHFVLLSSLLIASCNSWKPTAITPDLSSGAKSAVMSDMKDPSSAQFGDRMAASASQNGNIAICGTVNGKNSFGAYSGITTFAVKYIQASGKYELLGMKDQEIFCELAGAIDFSKNPPASLLATQGIKLPANEPGRK